MNGEARDRLTATRLATLRQCPRKHYFRFELGLSCIRTSDALRLGAAFHRGLELRNQGVEPAEAIEAATANYADVPEWADEFAWRVECETVRNLLAGYFWRYENDDVEIFEVERTFEVLLVNPHTGRPSRTFVLAGKIDAIVRLPDGPLTQRVPHRGTNREAIPELSSGRCVKGGRLAVLEYKTAGEDISPDSAYWLRLRCDPQISMYVLAARAIGYDVATVLYDVTRKPTIRPRSRPQPETPEQYGVRLLQDIGQRPDYYFQRREVPRLEDELAEFQIEVWQQAKQLLEARRHGRWFRNVHRFTCGTCDYSDICLNGTRVAPGEVPGGYELLSDVHPELATGDDA